MVNLMVLEISPLQMLSLAMLLLVLPIQYCASSRGAFFWPLSFALPNSSSVPHLPSPDQFRSAIRDPVQALAPSPTPAPAPVLLPPLSVDQMTPPADSPMCWRLAGAHKFLPTIARGLLQGKYAATLPQQSDQPLRLQALYYRVLHSTVGFLATIVVGIRNSYY